MPEPYSRFNLATKGESHGVGTGPAGLGAAGCAAAGAAVFAEVAAVATAGFGGPAGEEEDVGFSGAALSGAIFVSD